LEEVKRRRESRGIEKGGSVSELVKLAKEKVEKILEGVK